MDPRKNIGTCKRGNWFGKPYYFFGDYLQHRHGVRILKLPIDSGLSCPNRVPERGLTGCIFCGDDGSASPTTAYGTGIEEQMASARAAFRRSDRDTKYIAYFQAFTNTNAPVQALKSLYDRALSQPDIVGLMIGTRPDCVGDDVLDLIASYIKPGFELWLEIGMQSCHDRSLDFLKRGHTHADTLSAAARAADRKIPVCAHLILGIPGETWKDMMDTADTVAAMPLSGIKLHHLHAIRGTELDRMSREKCVSFFTMKEYVSTLCDFLERIRPDIIIHRLLGDRHIESLVAPAWGSHKGTVLREIEDEFARRGTYQSFLYGR